MSLPLIPFSPLCRLRFACDEECAIAKEKLEKSKESKETQTLSKSRKLFEDYHIAKTKADAVRQQLDWAFHKDRSWRDFSIDAIAMNWTLWDSYLFSKLSIEQDLVLQGKHNLNVHRCLDFHV